ncbi:MAG: lyase family protein, partial [Deltaproteobacteria bacterium]|nr:lyase family protein [Deltaproteobacteria bacterium]
LKINVAHVLMLKEQKILTPGEAGQILAAIEKLEKAGWKKTIHLDPRIGDLSTHVEAFIIKETGEEVGGKLHTGRSRNDIYPTLAKMLVRRFVLEVYEALVKLEETLLSLTAEHIEGYTHHSRPAQPITLGHYFLGNFDVFGRDLRRIEDFWPRLNTCPMGAAALATTGFPLDRSRVAELLGFDGFHEHSYDAISGKDFLVEYLFILSMVASDMGRIAENILLWATFEFGMIVLADEYTSFSTIMPQKKNPVAVESLRALNPVIAGKLFNAFGILKAEPWSNGRETTILEDDS